MVGVGAALLLGGGAVAATALSSDRDEMLWTAIALGGLGVTVAGFGAIPLSIGLSRKKYAGEPMEAQRWQGNDPLASRPVWNLGLTPTRGGASGQLLVRF